MIGRSLRRMLSLLAVAAVLFAAALSASALDDTYRFDEFGMSMKISKNYYVITRDTPQDDPAFTTLKLNRGDVMASFEAADIYLRAYDPDGIFQISLTIRKDDHSTSIHNYAELSESERRAILDALLAESSVTSAVEVKHGSCTFFDTSRESSAGGAPLYINQCNTIVNGLQIDLSIRKSAEPLVASEAKVLTTAAASLEFDESTSSHAGPVFDWWRLLLWIFILAALSVTISLLYRHRNQVKRRRLEERRRKRAAAEAAQSDAADAVMLDDESVSFDEALGYRDGDRFSSRAGTDLDSFDISVREKDPTRGVSYFEDGGKSIDDHSSDYFESYFKESTPARSGISRLLSTIGAYIGIAFRHVGYFFRNLWNKIKPKKD